MSTTCTRCRRPLKNEESIKRGLGHVCAIKSGIIKPKERLARPKKRKITYHKLFEFEVKKNE